MNIEDYKCMITIADCGSISSAADKLFLTQPSLSLKIKSVEEKYDIRIFDRGKRGVQVTPEGERFLFHARRILECESDIWKDLQLMDDNKMDHIAIGFPQIIYSDLFYDIIKELKKRYVDLHVDIYEETSSQIQKYLKDDVIDIGVSYLPLYDNNLEHEVIFRDSFVVVPASGGKLDGFIKENGLERGASVDPGWLDGSKFATGKKGRRTYEYCSMIKNKYNLDITIDHTCINFFTLYSLARSGVANIIINRSFFDNNRVQSNWFYIRGEEDNRLSVALIWKKNKYGRKIAKEFLSMIPQYKD